MWKALEEIFAQDTEDRERSLITKLHTCKKENLSIPDYLKHFLGICDECNAIQKPISDDHKVSWLAIGSKYVNFINS